MLSYMAKASGLILLISLLVSCSQVSDTRSQYTLVSGTPIGKSCMDSSMASREASPQSSEQYS